MALNISSLLFLLTLLLYCSTTSPLHPLLSLKCTLPSFQSININRFTKLILYKLCAKVSQTGFANAKLNHFNKRIQYRLTLSPNNCSHCVHTARNVVLLHYTDSEAVTAWFDGCYIYYSYHHKFPPSMYATESSESNRTHETDLVQFISAVNALVLQFKTSTSLVSGPRFCHGDTTYNNNGSKLFGVAECVGSISAKQYEMWVGETVNKRYQCCSAKQKGIIATEHCMVQFGSCRFHSFQRSIPSGLDVSIYDYSGLDVSIYDSQWVGCFYFLETMKARYYESREYISNQIMACI